MVSSSGGFSCIIATQREFGHHDCLESRRLCWPDPDACLVAENQLSSILPAVSHTGVFLPGWNIGRDSWIHSHQGETERLEARSSFAGTQSELKCWLRFNCRKQNSL